MGPDALGTRGQHRLAALGVSAAGIGTSEAYDNHLRGGCFSGSAIEHDGKLFLMFTGTANNGNGFEQTQCIAYSGDGIHFEKYEGNPVLTAPEGVPTTFQGSQGLETWGYVLYGMRSKPQQ